MRYPIVALAILSVPVMTIEAQADQPKFLHRAIVEPTDGGISIRVNDPRPLDQAIVAIRNEFGWIIDYEDPPYQAGDLVDDTDTGWRKTHPGAKGVTRASGGEFNTGFYVSGAMEIGSSDEQRVLDKVLQDYEASSNPGYFSIKRETPNRFAIVGVATKNADGSRIPSPPVLDTPIYLPGGERTVGEWVKLVSQALTEASGYKVTLGQAPINLLLQSNLRLDAETRPAREFLARIAQAPRLPLVWRFLYDADLSLYFINLEPATKTNTGSGVRGSSQAIPRY